MNSYEKNITEGYKRLAENWEEVAKLKQDNIELLEKENKALKKQSLDYIRQEADRITGEWNGDESGLLEDRANAAGELIELLDQASVLIAELELDQPTYRTIKIKRL